MPEVLPWTGAERRYVPFEDDEIDEVDESSAADDALPQELPGKGKATAAMILLIVEIFMIGVLTVIAFLEMAIIAGEMREQVLPQEDLVRFYDVSEMIDIVQLAIYIACAVAVLVWIYRASTNLTLLRVEGLNHSPRWAVGCWFIPILNLFKPFQVVREIWRASNPNTSLHDRYVWKAANGTAVLGLWWACWIIGNIISNYSFRMSLRANIQLSEYYGLLVAHVIANALHIVAAICLITIIYGIRKRQTERYTRILFGDEDDEHEDDWM